MQEKKKKKKIEKSARKLRVNKKTASQDETERYSDHG